MQGNAYQIDKGPILEIPIFKPNDTIQNQIAIIVDYIIQLKSFSAEENTAFFELLIDAIFYELYFPEEIKAAGAEVLKHLNNLPELTEDEEQNLKITERVQKELSNPNHPVSRAMQRMQEIEEIKIIEGKQ